MAWEPMLGHELQGIQQRMLHHPCVRTNVLTQVARGIDRVKGMLPHLYQLAQVLSHVHVLSCMLILAGLDLNR